MKLWNVETGKLWEGSSCDARELLTRKGWTATEPVPVAPPQPDEIEVVAPAESIEVNFIQEESGAEVVEQGAENEETTLLQRYGEKPKRKYIRHLDR